MKIIVTIILTFATTIVFGQKEFQGKAVYMSKTTMDMSNFGRRGRQMSEAQKKQVAERMKSMLEKTFILSFNKTASTYKEFTKLASPTVESTRGFNPAAIFGGGGVKYKNTKEHITLEATEFFGKKFLISDTMEQPKWELGNETKQIGNYTCFKATLVKEVDPLDFSNMRRRGGEKDDAKKDSTKSIKITEDIEMPKQIVVTAWYTPQIPVSNGPGEYWGLPGLILEVNSGKTTVLCTEIVLNPSEKEIIEAPTKGKKITREEYNKTVKEKIEEMRERFRGGRNGGRRGGRL